MPDIQDFLAHEPPTPEEERELIEIRRELRQWFLEIGTVSLGFIREAEDFHRRLAEMETHGLNWTDVALFTTYDAEEQETALARLSVQIATIWRAFDRDEYDALAWLARELGTERWTAKRVAAHEGLLRARAQQDEPQTIRFGKSSRRWVRDNEGGRARFKPSVLGLPGRFSFVRWFKHKAIAEAGIYAKELFGATDRTPSQHAVSLLPLEENLHESSPLDGLAYIEDQETQEELRGMLTALLDAATPRERDVARVLLNLIKETGEDNISEAGRRLGIRPSTARELLRRVGRRRPDMRPEWL
jgi:hypothetical protein